jgi:outer membrane protein assembly factor BamD
LTSSLRRLFVPLLSVAVLSGCGGQVNMAQLNARELFDLGMQRYQKHKYLGAIEALQAAIFNFPGESHVDTAQYYLALSYFGNRDYVLAQTEFNRLQVNYPASAFAPQAQLMKAVSFFKGTPKHYGLDQTNLHTAVTQFEDFLIDYPESEAVPEARAYLKEAKTRLARKLFESGTIYTRLRDYYAARVYFQKVIDDYTETPYAADATYQIAESYFQQKNWDEAHTKFQNFQVIWPEHKWAIKAGERSCQAAFRGGKEAFEAGDMALAATRFERFRAVCGQDVKMLREVDAYLARIGTVPTTKADSAHAGS